MKVVKLMETRIVIDDITDMFCSNYDAMVLNLIKKKFNGRCYKSVYILDILRVITRSDLKCKNKSLDGYVYLDVQFESLCMLYENGEIIHNCKIVQILSKNVILAKSTHCSIQIKNPTKIDIFKEGDEIPVIVNDSRYPLFDTEISISSIPLMPTYTSPILNIIATSDMDAEHKEASETLLSEIDALVEEVDKFDKKAVKFFVELLYPYKKYKSFKAFGDALTLEEFDKIKEGDLVFASDRYLNEDVFYKFRKDFDVKSFDMGELIEVNISLKEMHDKLIFERKKNLEVLLGFLREYNIEKIKKNSILWQVYSSLKQ
jgi:hypothetical protein